METNEADPAVLDSFAQRTGATLYRTTVAEVDEEQAAIAVAQDAARKQLKEQRKAERKAEREEKREARHHHDG